MLLVPVEDRMPFFRSEERDYASVKKTAAPHRRIPDLNSATCGIL